MNPGRERTGEGTRRGTEESTMCKRENEGNEQQRELEVVFAQLVAIDREK